MHGVSTNSVKVISYDLFVLRLYLIIYLLPWMSISLYHVTLDTVLGDHQFFRGIQAVRIDFFNFKSCQYSMFYTNKLF